MTSTVTRLVNHIGLTVTDLETSVAFYRDVVGMEIAKRGFKTGGEWFDTLTENAGAIIDAVTLRAGDVHLQLVQYHAAGNPEPATGHNRVGNLHFCINVDDVDAKHAEITASGAHQPTAIVKLPVPGVRSFYVRDPDGVPVEFLQLPGA
ncbi:VOC family protein [Nocardia sp. NPDC052278]|uniref:VOC family protein n=1 Tax=unclassified Nocardia TaxID=2637762 RepID=UPI0036A91CFE